MIISFASLLAFSMAYARAPNQQTRIESLEAELKTQYAAIEKLIAAPPPIRDSVPAWRVELAAWQAELAHQFGLAADLVEEIIKTNPPQSEMWRERLETLRLYAQPISSPDSRTIYGAGEVQKRARILDAPAAAYTDEVLVAKVTGDVRLRMVLASDGTVKYIFPIKSLGYGSTETAMEAARRIRFEAAIRKGQPASQFVTFVYEFKDGHPSPPYIPKTVF
jgi:TonB family protein